MSRRARRGGRPEVTLENYEAVYRFYGPGRRRDAIAHQVLRLATLIWAPRVEVSDAVAAQIYGMHESGTGVVLAANHPSGHDALVLASTVWDERIRFLAGGTGLGKDSLYSGPLRPIFEYTGTIPVFRSKSYPEAPPELHNAATGRMLEVCSERLRTGGVVLSFVEGTNSAPEDLRALRPGSVKRGIGQIVHGSLSGGQAVALLPVGISYRGRERAALPPRRAFARIGRPVLWDSSDPVPTVDEVREVARGAINAALAEAWSQAERD